MIKLIPIIVLTFLMALLVSCEKKEVAVKNDYMSTSDVKIDKSLVYVSRKSSVLTSTGLIFLYKKGKQLFLHASNQGEVLIDENTRSQRHHWLSVSGNYIYVFWWEKNGTSLGKVPTKLNKTIYVRVSNNNGKTFGEKTIVNTKEGRPLAKLSIVSDDKGNASVFYLDERIPAYEVFVNTTHDGGKSWSKDLMLNDDKLNTAKAQKKYFAVSPNINKIGNELVATWHEAGQDNEKYTNRLFSRVSFDQGRTWGEKKEIYLDKGDYSLQIKSFSKQRRLFLVITQAGKGLYVLYKDEGSDWVGPSAFAPGTDKAKSASYIAMDADDKYLYVTYIKVPPNGGKKDWQTILQRYNLQKNAWEDGLHRFDAVFGLSKTRGGYQDLALFDDGAIIATWEDYRYVLPVILISYSLDQGETWSTPAIINQQTDTKTHAVEKFPFILMSNKTAQIFFEYSDLKEGGIPYATTKTIKLVSPKQQKLKLKEAVVISGEDMKKKLIKRFDNLMAARVSKDWEKAWGFIDPVYRNLYSKKSWISTRDRLEYLDYEFLSAKVEGSEGKTSAIISFSIGNSVQGVTPQAKHLKNKRKSTEMKWGWFGDDWYYIAEDPRTPYMP